VAYYKILFEFEAYMHESIVFFANTTFVWATHVPPSSHTLLRNQLFPLDPRYCNIYHSILLMTISPLLQYIPYHIVDENIV